MNWGFFSICMLMSVGLSIALVRDGQPRTDKWNFLSTLTGFAIELVMVLWAMHWRLN